MSKMAEEKKDKEALRGWYKAVLDATVREMLKVKAISGAAIEAAPIWAFPNEILIAKVWDATQKSQFIWTISGKGVVTDHIPGSMAATPKEAARHFSLKWQMDAERLTEVAKSRRSVEQGEAHMKEYTARLVACAETLYDMTTQDKIWKQQANPAQQPPA